MARKSGNSLRYTDDTVSLMSAYEEMVELISTIEQTTKEVDPFLNKSKSQNSSAADCSQNT